METAPFNFSLFNFSLFNLSLLNILVLAAFGLLILVTGGISYLTVVDWRDRRRREQENREQRRR